METQSEKQLIDIMLQYFEEAGYIADNFVRIRQDAGETVRKAVVEQLKQRLALDFWVEAGNATTNTYSQIWIGLNKFQDAKLYFGVESFSGYGWHNGNLFIGIFNDSGGAKSKFATMAGNSNTNIYWVDQYIIRDYSGLVVNFKNTELLKKYYSDPSFKDGLISHIVEEIICYLKIKSPALEQFLTTEPARN